MRKSSTVPATPLYALMIRSDEEHGLALTLDGEEIATGSDIEALRAGGLSELRVRAALAGRPVRARAVEPTCPTPWNMIVCPDGTVVDVAEHPAAPAPVKERPAPPAPPTPAIATAPPAPAVLPALLLEVEAYREMWAAVWSAHAEGDLPTAVALAYKLETALVELVRRGRRHRHRADRPGMAHPLPAHRLARDHGAAHHDRPALPGRPVPSRGRHDPYGPQRACLLAPAPQGVPGGGCRPRGPAGGHAGHSRRGLPPRRRTRLDRRGTRFRLTGRAIDARAPGSLVRGGFGAGPCRFRGPGIDRA